MFNQIPPCASRLLKFDRRGWVGGGGVPLPECSCASVAVSQIHTDTAETSWDICLKSAVDKVTKISLLYCPFYPCSLKSSLYVKGAPSKETWVLLIGMEQNVHSQQLNLLLSLLLLVKLGPTLFWKISIWKSWKHGHKVCHFHQVWHHECIWHVWQWCKLCHEFFCFFFCCSLVKNKPTWLCPKEFSV